MLVFSMHLFCLCGLCSFLCPTAQYSKQHNKCSEMACILFSRHPLFPIVYGEFIKTAISLYQSGQNVNKNLPSEAQEPVHLFFSLHPWKIQAILQQINTESVLYLVEPNFLTNDFHYIKIIYYLECTTSNSINPELLLQTKKNLNSSQCIVP